MPWQHNNNIIAWWWTLPSCSFHIRIWWNDLVTGQTSQLPDAQESGPGEWMGIRPQWMGILRNEILHKWMAIVQNDQKSSMTINQVYGFSDFSSHHFERYWVQWVWLDFNNIKNIIKHGWATWSVCIGFIWFCYNFQWVVDDWSNPLIHMCIYIIYIYIYIYILCFPRFAVELRHLNILNDLMDTAS